LTKFGGVRSFGQIGRALFLIVGMLVLAAGIVQADDLKGYALGAGDKLRITVFNEPDLSGEFDINGQGFVSVPLIGQIKVIGQTTSDVQALLTVKYGKDYLVNPRVNVEVLNYRPFFILGEVNHPGSYPYVNGMTVINAVALAGGYTPRANHDGTKIRHSNEATEQAREVKEDSAVLPGDVIEVPERFF
jgi:protein involved in polysaccharide export with SLBB domain